jgi:type IX secretion system PorP/SprF family membrane protein
MKSLINYIKKCNGAILMLFIITMSASAQVDPHFSQYYAYPQWLNPALTGVIDGDYRAGINFKQQWGSINNAFITGGASFEKAPAKNFAFGATVMNQNAGELDFNYLTALVSGSYRIRFGAQGLNIINFGLQAGIINRSFNGQNARFGDQFNGANGFDSGATSSETISSNSALAPDINAGILYFDANPDQAIHPFFGVSVAHINQPKEKFLGSENKLPMRFTAHGGTRIMLNDNIDIMPNALFMYQGNAREIAAGGYAQIAAGASSTLMVGGNYRFDDAAIAYLGFQHKNMVFGLSYDVNTSNLSRASKSNGGFELSITLLGRRGIIGPNFYCPRL